jgi:hypothetical protein
MMGCMVEGVFNGEALEDKLGRGCKLGVRLQDNGDALGVWLYGKRAFNDLYVLVR